MRATSVCVELEGVGASRGQTHLINCVKILQDRSIASYSCFRLKSYSGSGNRSRAVDVTNSGGDFIILVSSRMSKSLVLCLSSVRNKFCNST